MSDNKAIEKMIATEQERLNKIEEKQAVLAKKAKGCKTNIQKYKMMKSNQQFNVLSNALNGKGISMEDILAAVSAGDMLTLQEKIETKVESGNMTDKEPKKGEGDNIE